MLIILVGNKSDLAEVVAQDTITVFQPLPKAWFTLVAGHSNYHRGLDPCE